MKLKIILLFIISYTVNAQNIRPFFGVGYNRHSEFSNQSYYNINAGVELNLKKYIKPEIEVSYFLGIYSDRVSYNTQGDITAVLGRKFSALNFVFCPKIILFENEDRNYYFQILPKYNVTKIETIGEYLLINQNNTSNSVDREVNSKIKQSIGFGAGIVLNFSKTKSDALAVNLYYHNIDFGGELDKLNHSSSSSINTKDVLSFGIIYYFNLGTKKAK